jgi:hypothetical protein
VSITSSSSHAFTSAAREHSLFTHMHTALFVMPACPVNTAFVSEKPDPVPIPASPEIPIFTTVHPHYCKDCPDRTGLDVYDLDWHL